MNFAPSCSHPGCNELHGSDDPLIECPPPINRDRSAAVANFLA